MDAAVRLLWQYLQDYANLLNWCVSIFLVNVLATKVDNEFEKAFEFEGEEEKAAYF